MKTYKELYTILLERLESGYGWSGVCQVIMNLHFRGIISEEERNKLQRHFEKQKPTSRNKFKLFYKDPLFINRVWWWKNMEFGLEYRAVRILFIKAIIKTLK